LNPIVRDLAAVELRAHHLIPALNNALEYVREQITYCDGFASQPEDVRVSTSRSTSPTERAAAMRYALTCHREDVRDVVTELHKIMTRLDVKVRKSYSLNGPAEPTTAITVALCRDGLAGKDGSLEWGDPTCMMPAVKGGCCQAHYKRWYRWRIAHGKPVDRDFEPAR